MPKRVRAAKPLPAKYPTIPDYESGPTRYNEPELAIAADRMPGEKFQSGLSKADLRLQIEAMLLRRDSLSAASWSQLGDDARAMLVDLLDDEAIRSREAIFHRLISVNAQLMVKRSVAPLAAILTDKSESSLTKAYAANALGRIGEPAALAALAASINTDDEMVRRQVAIALGRIDREAVIPHLIRLQDDKSTAVAEVASQSLAVWEKKLNRKFVKRKTSVEKQPKKKILPAEER